MLKGYEIPLDASAVILRDEDRLTIIEKSHGGIGANASSRRTRRGCRAGRKRKRSRGCEKLKTEGTVEVPASASPCMSGVHDLPPDPPVAQPATPGLLSADPPSTAPAPHPPPKRTMGIGRRTIAHLSLSAALAAFKETGGAPDWKG